MRITAPWLSRHVEEVRELARASAAADAVELDERVGDLAIRADQHAADVPRRCDVVSVEREVVRLDLEGDRVDGIVRGQGEPRDPRALRSRQHPDRPVDRDVGFSERSQGGPGAAHRDDAAVAVAPGHETAHLPAPQPADEAAEGAVRVGPVAPPAPRAVRRRVAVAGGGCVRSRSRRACGRRLPVIAVAAGAARGEGQQGQDAEHARSCRRAVA